MNDSTDGHDLVGAYVLEALTPEERDAFEAHLRDCPACQAEVAELRQVVDVLPLAAEPVEPPSDLRGRILQSISAEPDAPSPLVPIRGGRPFPRRPVGWRFPEVLVAVAAAVLVIGLGLWNVHLQQEINRDRASLAYQQQIKRAIASGAAVSLVPGTSAAPSASAALVQPKQQKPAYLIVQGLPSTPSNRVYEVWLIRSTTSAPRPAGVFTYRGNDPQTVQLPTPATSYHLTAVTLEPGPHGTRAPTGDKYLLGTVRT